MPPTGPSSSGTAPAGTRAARWWCPTASTWCRCRRPLVTEAVANRAFADLDALEAVLVDRCRTLQADWATIHDLTCYGWWPSDAPLVIRN